jgi:cell division protein FtsI/penicillin-binding protein 2
VDRQGRPIVDAWFVGYAPVDVPQVAVAVFVEGGGSGGNCAARIFREIIDALHRV